MPSRRPGAIRRTGIRLVTLALLAGGINIGVGLSPATLPAAQAATITIGQVTAQMSDHAPTSGNCIRYAPVNTSTSSAYVNSSGEARTAHGYGNNCPTNLSTSTQSAVGVVPTAATTAQDGTPFLLGKVTHYNNPVTTSDDRFTGKMSFQLAGVTGANTFTWDWTLWETSNSSFSCPSGWWKGNGNCLDQIKFTSAISQQTVTIGGASYRLAVDGFRAPASNGTCPAAPSGGTNNEFLTDESAQTSACIYVSLVQVRSLKIVKKVVGPAGVTVPSTTFGFGSTSNRPGSPWDAGSFNLSSSSSTSGSTTKELLQTESVSVTEAAPSGAGSDRWALTGIACVDGTGATVPQASYNLAARKLDLANVPAPATTAAGPITCTFTNTYTPKGTLTLVKTVQNTGGGSATAASFTLTGTGPTTISGPGGSAAVTSQRVGTGSYDLTETGPVGYVSQGWSCSGGTGNGANGSVTVGDGQNVTCTVVNRYQTGTFKIAKMIADPANGFTGTASTPFTGTYNCGSGNVAFSVSTGTGFTSPAIPVGRTCTVTETQPTGNLKNASYSWSAPSYADNGVTIADGTSPTVTITNTITQATGSIRVTKIVAPRAGTPAGGYTGGDARAFPVTYSCSLPADTVVASGTVDVTPGTPAVVPGIAAGATCTFTETLSAKPGDFADGSYGWDGNGFAPASVTVAAGQTTSTTVTNHFKRNLADLVLKKVVQGGGYVGSGTPFAVTYDCGNNPVTVNLAASGAQSQQTVSVPANVNCTVVETAPAGNLLAASHEWGTPSYAGLTNGTVAVPTGGSKTVTVTNPTVPVYAKLSVTKAIAPTALASGVASGTTFPVTVACDQPASGGGANYQHTFDLAVGGTATTPDLPVGTSCTVTENAPSGSAGLVDDSYVWDGAPAPVTKTLSTKNTTVSVTVTNKIKRAYGDLAVTKAVDGLNGVNGAGTTFSGTWSCVYGGDAPVTGTWQRTGAGAATVNGPTGTILLGSTCTITENAPSPAAPSATDASYVWGAETITPASVKVTKANPTATFDVTNPVRRVTGSFAVGKVVDGGTAGTAYADQPFTFSYSCTPAGGGTALTGSLQARAGQTTSLPAGVDIPAGSSCTITEGANPAPTDPYRWDDGVSFSVTGATGTASGRSVDFTTPADGGPVTVQATNTISPREVDVAVTKRVVDPDGGFTGAASTTFQVSLTCAGTTYGPSGVKAGATVSFTVPLGVSCSASEAPVPAGAGLADASFAWSAGPDIAPASVKAAEGSSPTITVTNTVERVRGPIGLTKIVDEAGHSGVLAADRTYSGTWSCTYGGQSVGGAWTVDGAGAATLTGPAGSVLLTSQCTATENDRGAASGDPSYVWETPTLTGVTVSAAGPNTMKVTNKIKRLTGGLLVTKKVTGETDGYTRTGADFTVAYHCYLADPATGPFFEGEVQVVAGAAAVPLAGGIPRGWTCEVRETAPTANLLRDASYAWGGPTIEIDGDETDTVEIDADGATVAVANPITRVTGDLEIRKAYGPGVTSGVIASGTAFTGAWSCVYDQGEATEETFSGTWRVTGTGDAALTPDPDLPLGTVCSVTEDALDDGDLADTSWTWTAPQVSGPVTVGTTTPALVVTNDVKRVYSDLTVVKEYDGPAAALPGGSTVQGAWSCSYDTTVVGQGRWELPATGGSVRVAGPAERIPAESVCTVTEDTLDDGDLADGSYTWLAPVIAPDGGVVTLTAAGGQKVTITNDVARVYGTLAITKEIAGGQSIDDDLAFTGGYRCTYGSDDPVTGTWTVTDEGTFTVGGVLVGSTCTATEDTGLRPAPVAGDPSFVWQAPVISPDSVTVGAGTTVTLTVTNTASRTTGAFAITKALTGATAGEPAGQTYTFDYSCVAKNGDKVQGTSAAIAAGGLWNAPDVPVGSSCTVSENALPALGDPSYSWKAAAYGVAGVDENGVSTGPAGVTFTLPAGQAAVVVTVTNELQRHTRAVEVVKTVSGTRAGYVAGDFAVDVKCTPVSGAAITRTLTVSPTASGTVSDVPIGSTCTVQEQATRPALADPSYRWGTPTYSPSGPVTVTAGQDPVKVTVDNPISRVFGTFTVKKLLTGTGVPAGAPQPATTYPFGYVCAVPGADDPVTGRIDVARDTVAAYDGPRLPQGSTCRLTEPSDEMPAPDRGFAWGDVSYTVDGDAAGSGRDVDLTIGAGTTVAVVATNTLHRTPGGYRVAKTSDPGSGAVVAPGDVITYTVTITPDGTNPVDDVVVVDDLAEIAPYATAVGDPVASQGTAIVDGQKIRWTAGTVDGSQPLTLTYRYKVDAAAVGVELRNVASATGEVPPTTCEPCQTTHETKAEWDLTKTADPASGSRVAPGGSITYTLTATSRSKKTAVVGIVVEDDLTAVLGNAQLQPLGTPSAGSVTRTDNRLVWQIPTLAPGAVATLSYTVVVNTGAWGVTLRNVVSGSAEDTPPSSCPKVGSPARVASLCTTEHTTPPSPGDVGGVDDGGGKGGKGGDEGEVGGVALPDTGSPASLPWFLVTGVLMLLCGGYLVGRTRKGTHRA
ncbi:DUF5979 domain-containing protein [Nocardioides sp. LHD-245]|uniref:DUF5979 domain-containing protein n=1 Tax=Nocardioides sp. LHD-245 TaxID=3051387 RepID=UPI0027DF817A|nr:DUF5979 domain-containing protein [Nocardioides sp. LHD-245]